MSPPCFLCLVVMPRVCRRFSVMKLRICSIVTINFLLSPIFYLCCINLVSDPGCGWVVWDCDFPWLGIFMFGL